MSAVLSPSPAASGMGELLGTYRPQRRSPGGARALAAMLLTAAVAALVALADQMISTWADGHLLLAWVALWAVIFAGAALFAGTARRMAKATLRALDSWSRSLAQARAEARQWEMARTDPRLKAQLLQARMRQSQSDQEVQAAQGAQDNFSASLAPMGLDSGICPRPTGAALRRISRGSTPARHGYLPYL